MKRGLTFKQVLDRYAGYLVEIRPRTIRFARKAKKHYWQVRYIDTGQIAYEHRRHD